MIVSMFNTNVTVGVTIPRMIVSMFNTNVTVGVTIPRMIVSMFNTNVTVGVTIPRMTASATTSISIADVLLLIFLELHCVHLLVLDLI